MQFLFLKFFLAEGSIPQVFGRFEEVKAERVLHWCCAPGSAGPTVPTAVPKTDRERIVGGVLIQEELAWLRDI
jgi:hypothetical protein